MINFEYYKVFYFAGKYMNFTKAAERLCTSQSAVSHTIQNLEEQLNCQLFIRNNRGISFTLQGERLYEHVSAGFDRFTMGEDELKNGISPESGTISIAATETALNCFLFDNINSFRQEHPLLKLKIENLTTYEAAESIREGVSDFAFLSTPIDISKPLQSKTMISFNDVLVCGSEYTKYFTGTTDLSSLSSYPLISLSKGTATRKFYDDLFNKHGVSLTPDIEIATSDMIIPMIENNIGIGFIPDILLSKYKGHNLFKIKTDYQIPKRSICMVYSLSSKMTPAARTLFNYYC